MIWLVELSARIAPLHGWARSSNRSIEWIDRLTQSIDCMDGPVHGLAYRIGSLNWRFDGEKTYTVGRLALWAGGI